MDSTHVYTTIMANKPSGKQPETTVANLDQTLQEFEDGEYDSTYMSTSASISHPKRNRKHSRYDNLNEKINTKFNELESKLNRLCNLMNKSSNVHSLESAQKPDTETVFKCHKDIVGRIMSQMTTCLRVVSGRYEAYLFVKLEFEYTVMNTLFFLSNFTRVLSIHDYFSCRAAVSSF